MGVVGIALAVINNIKAEQDEGCAVIHIIKAEQDGSCGHRLSSNS